MTCHRLRWALLCVAATYGALLATSAEASHTVVIKPGDSIDSLAREYHVSWKDIARVNGITQETLLIDGQKLTIPDPPRSVVSSSTMRRAARIEGDRIAVRLGPYTGYRRLTLLDHATSVIVTHKAGDWFQVELPDGRTGWVNAEFVSFGGNSEATRTAENSSLERARTRRSAQADEDRKERPRRKRIASTRHRKIAEADREERIARRKSKKIARAETRRRKRHVVADVPKERRRRHASVSTRRWARNISPRRRSHHPEAAAPESSDDVVRTAYAYRGVRYRYGGSSRGGFDCSGFTSYVYNRKGVNLPHSAAAQFHQGSKVNSGKMKQGDLVFFSTTRRGISHVGIYVGAGKFVHASSGGGRVRVDSLQSGYYRNRFRGARRVR